MNYSPRRVPRNLINKNKRRNYRAQKCLHGRLIIPPRGVLPRRLNRRSRTPREGVSGTVLGRFYPLRGRREKVQRWLTVPFEDGRVSRRGRSHDRPNPITGVSSWQDRRSWALSPYELAELLSRDAKSRSGVEEREGLDGCLVRWREMLVGILQNVFSEEVRKIKHNHTICGLESMMSNNLCSSIIFSSNQRSSWFSVAASGCWLSCFPIIVLWQLVTTNKPNLILGYMTGR